MLLKAKWLLAVTFVFACLGIGSAFAQTTSHFGLEIKNNESAKNGLRIYISTEGKQRLYAYVPVKKDGVVSYVKVLPTLKDGKLEVEFYEIDGDLEAAKTLAQKLLLPSKLVAKDEIVLQLDQTFTVHADSGWSLQLTIVDGSSLLPPKNSLPKN